MKKTAIILLAVFLCLDTFAAIGKLTEVTGPTQLSRAKDKIEGKVDVDVEMNDTVETLKARVGITFEDGTKVQCTEFSKLVIDDFVYDPNSGKGKLGLKTAGGTVRYTSGLIAKNSRENVKVKTPTASVSVRGTDFSLTVDELGRSLIILLPSLPKYGPPVVGTIEVSNAAGVVVMTKAYQATLVSSATTSPTAPVLLNFDDESRVNNNLIISTPKAVTQAAKEQKKEVKQDVQDEEETKKSKVAVEQVQKTVEEKPVEAAPVIVEPDTAKAIIDTTLTLVVPTTTVNNGFTSDGVRAYLEISKTNYIKYILKADTNATITVTDKESTTDYNLNFGSKLKINIIQQ